MELYDGKNLALLTDLYELTMIQGYYFYSRKEEAVFDMFFRRPPFGGGYTIFAGLEPLIKVILNLRFSDEDLAYLEKQGSFKPEFLKFLSKFRFKGDIYAVEEGEVVFPREPLIRVQANIIEAQLLEGILLNIVNFQTLIATKTARIVEAARGRAVLEFGLRRAQGIDGALSATRAAFIGGAVATSNTLGGRIFNIPVRGTMAHSWVMSFNRELDSFKKYAELYPEQTIILVDTYDTLEQGLPAAIKVFKKLKKEGIRRFGVRLDSGDLEYLSKQARKILDEAGFKEALIVVSNELDEYIIEQLMEKDSPIDVFGVGTNLVTAKGDSALTGVYKLVAKKIGRGYRPTIKISNHPEKITSPHIKNILRIYDKENLMLGDLIFLEREKKSILKKVRSGEPLMFFHPDYNCPGLKMTDYKSSRILLRNIVKQGRLNYSFPDLEKIQQRAKDSLKQLHPTFKRLLNPHVYKVSLTKELKELKATLINKLQ